MECKIRGLYKIRRRGTSTVVHFLGSGSASALQFLTRYGNGGLYYRSSRDGVGFENEYEKLSLKKAAQLKVVFQLMEFQILAIFLQQGTLLQVVLQEKQD